VRPPAQPAFAFNGKPLGPEKSEFRDVIGIAFDPDGLPMLGHKGGVTTFKLDGSIAKTETAQDTSAFFLDEQNRLVLARNGSLITAKADVIAFSGPAGDGALKAVDEIPAVIVNARGERIISNVKQKNVIRALPNGKFVSVFAQGQITRMAQNWMGDIALLDHGTKSVNVVDRDGKAISKIAAKGTGYELNEPTDVAFDGLGHLYVLDRGRSSIYVFGPKNKLVYTLSIPDRSPGALSRGEAMGIDAAGRLFVFDDRSHRIQVYQ
jgi:hypothetical protein